MDALIHANERTHEPLDVGCLPEARTPDVHFRAGDARQVADDLPALVAMDGPRGERAEPLRPLAGIAVEALLGGGDA